MSFIITINTHEGIVMAADSRLTLSVDSPDTRDGDRLSIEFSDATQKLFCTSSGVGISTCGDAGIKGNPIAGYLEEFVADKSSESVGSIAQTLSPFLKSLNPSLRSTFHVSGYADSGEQLLYKVYTDNGDVVQIPTDAQGATWSGITDVMQRLLSQVKLVGEDGTDIAVPKYAIPWNFFSLQDAVDFAHYAMKSTIDLIRFQNRAKTVGGPVDVLVIKRDGAEWLQRKDLSVE